MQPPFDITWRGFTFKILKSRKKNTLEIALMSKPKKYRGELTDEHIECLYYYLQEEGFIGRSIQLD